MSHLERSDVFTKHLFVAAGSAPCVCNRTIRTVCVRQVWSKTSVLNCRTSSTDHQKQEQLASLWGLPGATLTRRMGGERRQACQLRGQVVCRVAPRLRLIPSVVRRVVGGGGLSRSARGAMMDLPLIMSQARQKHNASVLIRPANQVWALISVRCHFVTEQWRSRRRG